MSILKIKNGDSFIDIPALQGPQGVSGVYVGSGDMPEGYNIQIDPTGEINPIDINLLSEDITKRLNTQITTLYVSPSYTKTDEGFGITLFNTIYDANESITDNSIEHQYIIKVADGTYTDLQERYAGIDNSTLEEKALNGIITKDYVSYIGNPKWPNKCIIEWDGATGFDLSTLDSTKIGKNCPFHIAKMDNSMHTTIQGFTFNCKNLRYCIHIESGGRSYDTDWSIKHCYFNWGGIVDCSDNKNSRACLGCGHGHYEKGLIECCKFNCENTNIGYQNHDNPNGTESISSVSPGAKIIFKDCDFVNTIIQCRIYYGTSGTNNLIILDNCVNISEIQNLNNASQEDKTDVFWKIREL